MMKLTMCSHPILNLSLGLAAVLSTPLGAGEFDTEAMLTFCADSVPNSAFSIPMDQKCVSTAIALCDLEEGQTQSEACLQSVTGWLVANTGPGDPTFPPLDAEWAELYPVPRPDCTTLVVPAISTQSLCAYQNALEGWMKHRVLMRAASDTK